MLRQTVTFVGDLAKLNEHDAANRSNKFAGAALKKRMTEMIASQCDQLEPVTHPVIVHFNWHISSKHDLDNIAFAKKYVLDGMVKSGKLPNDNQKWVKGFSDFFTHIPKGEEKVVVGIEEV